MARKPGQGKVGPQGFAASEGLSPAAGAAGTSSGGASPAGDNRQRIIEALLALLAERSIDEIGFADLSRRSGVPLPECRDAFGSVMEVLSAFLKDVDRKVLAGIDPDMAAEPPRERLFDVLMRRLELLAPHKQAMRSLAESAARRPSIALALNGLAARSQRWMLIAADIDSSGTRGMIRAQGLALLYARVMRTWLDDDDPGLARTMAVLDENLSRGARWSGFLDDMMACRPPFPFRRRRRRNAPASYELDEAAQI